MLLGYRWDLSSDGAFALSILPILLKGMLVTLQATLLGFVIALALGLLLALLRSARLKLLSWPSAFFIEFIRDTPLIIQLFFLYFVLPDFGLILPAFLIGTIALGLQYSAYTSEVYRAGLEAVPKGQKEAAIALNLPPARAFLVVVLPQAIPRIIPAMGNNLISMMKDVPVLSTITVLEMLTVAQIIGDRTFRYHIPLSMVGGLYLILTLLSSALINLLDSRLPKGGIPFR
jgi:polar amino acid transport system permease protein